MYEICSELIINTLEKRQWRLLVYLLLTLSRFHKLFCVFIVDSQQVSANWEVIYVPNYTKNIDMFNFVLNIIKVNYEGIF